MAISPSVRKRDDDDEGKSTAPDDKKGDEIPEDGSFQERKRRNQGKMEEKSSDSGVDKFDSGARSDSDFERNKGKMEEKSSDSAVDKFDSGARSDFDFERNKGKMEEKSSDSAVDKFDSGARSDSDFERNKGKMVVKSTDSDLDRNKGKTEAKSTVSDSDGSDPDCESTDSDANKEGMDDICTSYGPDEEYESDFSEHSNSDVEDNDPRLFQKSYWEAKRFPRFWPRDKPYDKEKDLYQDGFFPMGTDFGYQPGQKVANRCLPYYFSCRPHDKSDPVNILSREAIDLYNQANGEEYKFRQVENVNSRLAVGRFYYITFTAYNTKKANDGGEGPFGTFQALAYKGFNDRVFIKEYGQSKVIFCRPAKKK